MGSEAEIYVYVQSREYQFQFGLFILRMTFIYFFGKQSQTGFISIMD